MKKEKQLITTGKTTSNSITFILLDVTTGKIEKSQTYELGKVDFSSELSVSKANLQARELQLEFLKPLEFPDEFPITDKSTVNIFDHSKLGEIKHLGATSVNILAEHPNKLLITYLATEGRTITGPAIDSFAIQLEEEYKKRSSSDPSENDSNLTISRPSSEVMNRIEEVSKEKLISKLTMLKNRTGMPEDIYETLVERINEGDHMYFAGLPKSLADELLEAMDAAEDPNVEFRSKLGSNKQVKKEIVS